MKISVVMAVFNGEKHLREAIESILGQTFKDFEFIIVDDGSTDGTEEIIEHYRARDSRIRVIHQANKGLTQSLINGITQAKGEYIARQDADDVSLPMRFEIQVAALQLSAVLCGGSFTNIDETGEKLSMNVISLLPPDIGDVLKRGNIFAHGSLMFKKWAYDAVGGYNPAFRLSQDYELMLRLLKQGPFVSIATPIYRLRLCRGSLSLNQGKEQRRFKLLAQGLHCEPVSPKPRPKWLADFRYSYLRYRRTLQSPGAIVFKFPHPIQLFCVLTGYALFHIGNYMVAPFIEKFKRENARHV